MSDFTSWRCPCSPRALGLASALLGIGWAPFQAHADGAVSGPKRSMVTVTLTVLHCPGPDGGSHDETLTVCTDNPLFIKRAEELARSKETTGICMALYPGKGCDSRYRWSVDPKRVVWAEMLAAVWGLYCPSDVEKNVGYWVPPTGKGPGRDGSLCLPEVRVASMSPLPRRKHPPKLPSASTRKRSAP